MRQKKTKSNIAVFNNAEAMQPWVDQVWNLLEASYAQVEGGLSFASKEDLISSSASWKVALYKRQVIAVTIYKAKKGLKLVAMATSSVFKDLARKALRRIISKDLATCWMELSEQAERFVLKYCNGHRYIIHSSLVTHLLGKPVTVKSTDGYHYEREINSHQKVKIALGTPQDWLTV